MAEAEVHQFGFDQDLDEMEGVVPDKDLDAKAESSLDEIRRELSEEVAGQTITLQVLRRPGWQIKCDVDFEDGYVKAWRRRSKDRQMPDGIDDLKFACLVIASRTVEIMKNGIAAHDENDEPLTFRHKMMHEMTGTNRAIDAVRKVFARDAHVIAAGYEVLREAGYGEDVQGIDEETPI